MGKVTRCAIYIRVSSAEQVMHGHSLDAQTRFLSEYADGRGWKVVGIYADEGKTARKELKRRKAIKELLNHVEADEIDMILFWKMDRWFRNVADFYKVQDVLDAHDCGWTAAAEPSMNLETREGRLNVNIMLSINQNETDTTSERIKFVNESSVRQGKAIVGTPSMPLGYRVESVDGVKRIVKDPEKEDIVNEIFEYYLATHSKTGTMKYINQKYGYTIGPVGMKNLTTSTLYYGAYRDNNCYCPSYITKEQYDIMQDIRNNNVKVYNSQNRNDISRYVFTGLILCPMCGARMAGMTRKKKTGYTHVYYRCPKHYSKSICEYSKVLNERTAEEYLLDNLDRLYANEASAIYSIQEGKKTAKKAESEIPKLEKELERLNTMYQKGRITEEKYDNEYDRISALIASRKIVPIEAARPDRNVDIGGVLHDGWQDTYLELDADHKRTFWRGIIDHLELRQDCGQIASVVFLK